MKSVPQLKIDWVDRKSAEYAMKNWHYAKAVPAGRLNTLGVFEDGMFIGVIVFGRGASPALFATIDCDQWTAAELVRVALTCHASSVSRIMSIAMRMFRRANPKMRAVVSFADSRQKHHGGIYQACGWKYLGLSSNGTEYFINGRWMHSRNASEVAKKFGITASALCKEKRPISAKHKYVYFFDKQLEEKFRSKFLPYPKRVESIGSDASAVQAEEGGAIPTSTLQ